MIRLDLANSDTFREAIMEQSLVLFGSSSFSLSWTPTTAVDECYNRLISGMQGFHDERCLKVISGEARETYLQK